MNIARQSNAGRVPATAELAARWVRWAAASSAISNPLLDETGSDAWRKQPQDVWFLAGTMGGNAHREFAMPAGCQLFGPAFCMWGSEPISLADISHFFGIVRVNGKGVETRRVATGPFRVSGGVLNPVTRIPWLPISMHLAGIWVNIEPLAIGTNTIELRGGDGYGFEMAVDATVHVS